MTYSSADVQLTPDELKQHAELLRYIQNGDVKALEKLLQTEYSLDNLRQKIVGYISTHQTLTQLPDTKKTQIITLLINKAKAEYAYALLNENESLPILKGIFAANIDVYVRDKHNFNFFLIATLSRQQLDERFRLAFQHGVNVNHYASDLRNTTLLYLIIHEQSERVCLLIDLAHEYQVQIDFDHQDEYGQSALIMATKMGKADLVNKILEEALLGSVVNLDLRDRYGMTALHYAIAMGHVEIARALYKAGVNQTLIDNQKKIPFHYALSANATYSEISAARRQINKFYGEVSIEPTRDQNAQANDFLANKRGILTHPYKLTRDGFQRIAITANKQNVTLIKSFMSDPTSLTLKYYTDLKTKYSNNLSQKFLDEAEIFAAEPGYIREQIDSLIGKTVVEASLEDRQQVFQLAESEYLGWELRDAAHKGNEARVIELLQHTNCSVLSAGVTTGMTPLHRAAAKGHLSICRLLVASNAAVLQQQTIKGYTALQLAKQSGFSAVEQFLSDQIIKPKIGPSEPNAYSDLAIS